MNHRIMTFRSGNIEIFYRLFGMPGKTPLVIVHGLSYFSYDWIDPANELASDREVVAMDMRGFGESDWAKDYSIQANSGDIVTLLDSRGWKQAILVGHSMGGRHCSYCAATNPDRIAGLVLADWSPENAPSGSKRVAQTVAGTPEAFGTVDDAMKYFGADPHSPQGMSKRPRFEAYLKRVSGGYAVKRDLHFRDQFRQQLATGQRHKLGVDLWETLGKVSCPILVLRALRSDLFAAGSVGKVRATNPRVEFEEIDSGHNIADDNPEAFVRSVRGFLARHW
jgi:pimeloyl-ACP methyl ester carboxylesterase